MEVIYNRERIVIVVVGITTSQLWGQLEVFEEEMSQPGIPEDHEHKRGNSDVSKNLNVPAKSCDTDLSLMRRFLLQTLGVCHPIKHHSRKRCRYS